MAQVKYNPEEQPTADELVTARKAAGLSQSQAAALVHYRHYSTWAACEQGRERMDVARWHLFLLRAKLIRVS